MVTIERAHEIVADWIARLGDPGVSPLRADDREWPGYENDEYWAVPYNTVNDGGALPLVNKRTGEMTLLPQQPNPIRSTLRAVSA